MKNLNVKGQELIIHNNSQLAERLTSAMHLISQAQNSDPEQAKNKVASAQELIFKCCSNSFIVCDGLMASVLNEEEDIKKHVTLSKASKNLHQICDTYKTTSEAIINAKLRNVLYMLLSVY